MGHRAQERAYRPKEAWGSHPPPRHQLYAGAAMNQRYKVVEALMLFDTGPGFRNAEARRAWNERAEQRARDLDARGFAALGDSDEVRASKHRSARGLAGAARGMLAQADDNHIIAGLDKIAVPTLVLVGANDTHFLAAADYMTR